MKTNDDPRLVFGSVLLSTALLIPAGLYAESTLPDGHAGWSLRVYAASIDFDGSDRYNQGTQPDYDLDIGFGFGLSAEYRLSRRIGVDVGILGGAAVDVVLKETGPGEWIWTEYKTLTFTPLSAGLNIHLTPDKDVDVFVRPMLAWIHYGGLTLYSSSDWTASTVEFREDLGVGLALGLGVPFGQRDRWSFAASLAYLESDLESKGWDGHHMTSDYDATILGLGFGYRFGDRE